MFMLGLSLTIMIGLSIYSIILGSPTIIQVNIDSYDPNLVNNITEYITEFGSYTFKLDVFIGAIGILIGIVSLSAVVGFGILGSGLDSSSVKVVIVLTAFITLWTLFSVIVYDFIASIVIIGSFIYWTLTIMYAVDVVRLLSL